MSVTRIPARARRTVPHPASVPRSQPSVEGRNVSSAASIFYPPCRRRWLAWTRWPRNRLLAGLPARGFDPRKFGPRGSLFEMEDQRNFIAGVDPRVDSEEHQVAATGR